MRDYIINNVLKVAEGSNLRPCIKQSVYAMLVTAEGKEYFGANWMSEGDFSVCPRVTAGSKSGEDYHFCKDICNQLFHAERSAMFACENAGDSTIGATVYVVGHTYCCQYCIAAMMHAFVKKAFVVDSGKEYIF